MLMQHSLAFTAFSAQRAANSRLYIIAIIQYSEPHRPGTVAENNMKSRTCEILQKNPSSLSTDPLKTPSVLVCGRMNGQPRTATRCWRGYSLEFVAAFCAPLSRTQRPRRQFVAGQNSDSMVFRLLPQRSANPKAQAPLFLHSLAGKTTE